MLKAFYGAKLIPVTFLVCLALSLIIEQWARACGLIMTPDSYHYFSASRSFRTDGIFLNTDGTRFTSWPPLFPFILSAFSDPQQALVWINALCKLILGSFIYYLSNLLLTTRAFIAAYLVVVLLGVHLLLISVFFWSELIFMTLLFANIYFTLKLKNRPLYFYLMIVTGFLFCLQRNAGLFWVTGTSVWLMLNNSPAWSSRFYKSISYFIFCTSGLWTWNLYNTFFSANNSVFSGRSYFSEAFLNIQAILFELGVTMLPFRGVFAIFTGALMMILLLFLIVKNFHSRPELKLLALGLIAYTAGLIPVSYLATDIDRYYSVISPIAILLFFMCLEKFVLQYPRAAGAVIICATLWLVYPLARTVKNAILWHERSCYGVSDK